MDSPENIGSRVRTMRLAQRMTQAELAAALGVSVSHLSKVEIGRHGLSRNVAERVCELWGCSADWLMYGKGRHPLAEGQVGEGKPTWVTRNATEEGEGRMAEHRGSPRECLGALAEMFEVDEAKLRAVVYRFVAQVHGGVPRPEKKEGKGEKRWPRMADKRDVPEK